MPALFLFLVGVVKTLIGCLLIVKAVNVMGIGNGEILTPALLLMVAYLCFQFTITMSTTHR